MKMLTHIHIVVYTWWCWHIYKEEGVGVETDQLGEETEAKWVTGGDKTLYLTLASGALLTLLTPLKLSGHP
jgi:hypothetical protein